MMLIGNTLQCTPDVTNVVMSKAAAVGLCYSLQALKMADFEALGDWEMLASPTDYRPDLTVLIETTA
jgi:hypothetical protein